MERNKTIWVFDFHHWIWENVRKMHKGSLSCNPVNVDCGLGSRFWGNQCTDMTKLVSIILHSHYFCSNLSKLIAVSLRHNNYVKPICTVVTYFMVEVPSNTIESNQVFPKIGIFSVYTLQDPSLHWGRTASQCGRALPRFEIRSKPNLKPL